MGDHRWVGRGPRSPYSYLPNWQLGHQPSGLPWPKGGALLGTHPLLPRNQSASCCHSWDPWLSPSSNSHLGAGAGERPGSRRRHPLACRDEGGILPGAPKDAGCRDTQLLHLGGQLQPLAGRQILPAPSPPPRAQGGSFLSCSFGGCSPTQEVGASPCSVEQEAWVCSCRLRHHSCTWGAPVPTQKGQGAPQLHGMCSPSGASLLHQHDGERKQVPLGLFEGH